MTRSHGKVTVLACGYGGGGHAMLKMGGRSLVPGQENMLDDEVARELYPIAEKWRAANPRVVQFWTDLERAFAYGGKAGRIDVEVVGCDRWVWLPSGRPLVYHNVRQEWFTTPKGRAKHAWHFDNPGEDRKRIPRVETYSGRLAENCTQAVARDVLAAALVNLEAAGYPVVMHVHDEALVERVDPTSSEAVASIMSQPLAWTGGLPLKVAGTTMNRYRKD